MLELPVSRSRLMFTLRISYPLILAGALAPARQLHCRMRDAAEAAKSDARLRHGLQAWANSMTTMNCPWYEYPLRDEMVTQMRKQGILPWNTSPISGARHPPPKTFGNAIDALTECAFEGVCDILVTARHDDTFRLKLIVWARIMAWSRSWPNRWVAREIMKRIKSQELDSGWAGSLMLVCSRRIASTLIASRDPSPESAF